MIPFWLKIAYILFIGLIVPVYANHYGWKNFLWFSDIALILTLPALWFENALLASMMTVSVGILEIIWNVDYFGRLITGGRFFGLSNYMFDAKTPLFIRALSLFHVVLPPLLFWLTYKLGYDTRALPAQTVFAWIVLTVTYLLKPSENINWIYGFGDTARKILPAPLYIALLMLAFPLLIYLPTHLILKKLFA
ncbi:MAG: hypothetical protein NVSMB56_16760 [Pyrinomonadaceae bacterium]